MRLLFTIISSLVIFSFFAQPVFASDWKQIEKGLSYKSITFPQNNTDVTLHVLKADPKTVAIKPVFSKHSASARYLANKFDALAVVNANFFDERGKVLGLVKQDRKVIHPIKKISWWSILCLRWSHLSIIHSSKVKGGYCHQAVQAGPRIVVKGSIPKLKDELSFKTAAGINSKGDLVLAVSDNKMPIKKLAEIFQASEKKGGLGCRDALNLDGGSSSQMYVKTDNFKLNQASYMKIPVGLGIFKK